MDSATPRERIDQFYVSKKRKSLSPALKFEKTGKELNITGQVSPSAKGNLDTYLRTSQDNDGAVKLSTKCRRLLTGHDSLKGALESEISKPLGSECGQSHSVNGMQTVRSFEKEKLHGVFLGDQDLVGGCPLPAQGTENSELKQFATDFLSLYCSELQQNVNVPSDQMLNTHKRHCSPLGKGLNETSEERQCFSKELQSVSEIVSPGDKLEGVPSRSIVNCKEDDFKMLVEAVDSSPPKLQLSLRKCSEASMSVINSTECKTPGTSIVTAGSKRTPKSMSGSSMISPGEAFWNEAIQMADELFAREDVFPAQIAENIDDDKSLYEIHLQGNKNEDEKLGKVSNEYNGALVAEVGTSLQSLRKCIENKDKEVSPLPVKHLDFLYEDKITNGSSTSFLRDCEPSECVNVNHSGLSSCIKHHDQAERRNKVLPALDRPNVKLISTENVGLVNQDKCRIAPTPAAKEINGFMHVEELTEGGTPSSTVLQTARLSLNNWLSSELCSTYRKKGISELYPWQVDCLQVEGVLQKRNLVYCASTSAGKSFVAEILMLRRVISTGKMALLVLPYVSICSEKAEHLEHLLEPLGRQVRSYYGNQGGGTLPKDTSVAVCTIEKANSLVNKLLEEGRLSEIGIIVIDELHMVGDQSRGYLLELLLTKLRYASGEGSSDSSSGGSPGSSSGKSDPACGLQIVGMSATMPNVEAVANWLQAALYQTDFRPVPLEEYIKVGNTIYNKKLEIIRTIPRRADLGGKDPDHVVELCNEVVQEGNSVLIFCSSRKGCETTARHISKFLQKFSATVHSSESEFPDIASAIEALKRCPVGLDPVLEETLPSGVAYHHAGLTVEEREIIETCYRKGLVRVLTATSTLAAGVNLPARRVIFRQPRIGRDFIDGTRYKQMAGRAGRTGIDTKGESVLICRPEETKRVTALVCESCPPLQSCLSEDKNGMTHAILEVVAGSMVQTASDIHRYVRCTLLNSTKPFEDVVKSAQDSLRWLCHKKFLDWNEETKLYIATPLGRASFGSSLCPAESLIVLDDLLRAREGFVLASDLHLVYLVTPINVDVEPDWELYYELFMQLSKLEQSVGYRVGVAEPFLMRMAHGAPIRAQKSRDGMKGLRGKIENQIGVSNNNVLSDEQTLRVCKRFYVALILSRLVQEAPVSDVCEAFKVARGMVQALQENAGRFASMVSVFCERLGWHDLEGLVAKFQNRVSFGVRAEIVELTTIPYVKGSRARALYKAGLRTPQAIAEASVPEIVKALFESSSWAAQECTAQCRLQLRVAKKIKNGARKIVLDKAEEAQLAAFSAFKSLGLNVPQLSRPLLATATMNRTDQEDADTILGNISPVSVIGGEKADNVTVELRTEANPNVENAPIRKEVSSGSASQTSFRAEIPEISIRGYATEGHQFSAVPVQNGDTDIAAGRGTRTGINCLDQEEKDLPNRDPCLGNKDSAYDNGPINAITFPGGFDSFLELWGTQQEYYFDIHYNKCSEVNSKATFEIHGIAICWVNSLVYYISVPTDLMWCGNKKNGSSLTCTATDSSKTTTCNHSLQMLQKRWGRICEIMGKVGVLKITWNLKVQIQALKRSAVSVQRFGGMDLREKYSGLEFIDSSYLLLSPVEVKDGIDMSIVAWLLWPDEERCSTPNLEKEVKKRLSGEAAAAVNQCGRWKNQMRRAAHNGCCRRVAQIRALYDVLWKLLVSEELIEVLMSIETPLVNVLADMELSGMGINMEGCLWARNLLGKKLRCLEKEAQKLAGMTFSLYTAADVANILFVHLKLPIPEGCSKTKQHLSTDKHCLDLLRNEHPIVPVIKEHRTLAKLLNCTLGSICSLARLSPITQKHMLHGRWLQTSTATGRLSMEEPNLQCVEHMVDFKLAKDKNEDDTCYKVNVRDFFTPTQDNWVILTADYSQIELRLMAHLSRDSSLIELLSRPEGDVFTMMTARWTERPENSVSSQEREQIKRLIYGILYGMGADTLAEQLNCSSDEAKEKIESFKSSFPGVASWLRGAVSSCRQRGYVKTLMGRKRFLSKIKYGDNKEKSKAQRQAVNSICQGSAADIIKVAMINIYTTIVGEVDRRDPSSTTATKFDDLKGRCRMLLQVHDELVLEVEPSVVKEAACLVQTSMEGAASLLVPLQVKLKIGRTWGSLEPFHSVVVDEMLEQKTKAIS